MERPLIGITASLLQAEDALYFSGSGSHAVVAIRCPKNTALPLPDAQQAPLLPPPLHWLRNF